jgi:hypothetical protein
MNGTLENPHAIVKYHRFSGTPHIFKNRLDMGSERTYRVHMDTTTCVHNGTVSHACGHEFAVTVEDGAIIQIDLPTHSGEYRCECGAGIDADDVWWTLRDCDDTHGRED